MREGSRDRGREGGVKEVGEGEERERQRKRDDKQTELPFL